MKIEAVTDKQFFLDHLDWLRDIPFSDMTYIDCLERCLTGKYQCLAGYIDGKPVGLMVYYINGDSCWVVGLWAKNNYKKFSGKMFELLKNYGVKLVRCSSVHENFERLTGMKKLHTVYERYL